MIQFRTVCWTILLQGLGLCAAWGADPVVIPLWPQGAPGAVGSEEADRPTLTVWSPTPETWNGSAVILCPGGGYGFLAVDHEGKQVAEWLNSLGVTTCMLKYRLAPRYRHPAPMQDVQQALRLVRSRASELKIDPRRVGVMGFSAGGHLASTAATHFDAGRGEGSDVERQSSRPDFCILCYPVISFTSPATHAGSRKNLLGDQPTEELMKFYSNELHVTPQTPPTFLFHTNEDGPVPAENSLLFYAALRQAKVPAELHIYEKGTHGVGLAPKDPILSTWPQRLADWLKGRGYLEAPKPVFAEQAEVTDPDYPFQGEYSGELTVDGATQKIGVQLIALGRGKFQAMAHLGGLPGDGWDGFSKFPATGERKGDVVELLGESATARLEKGLLTVTQNGQKLGQLKRVERQSPTLDAPPPENAIVLFSKSKTDGFPNAKVTADGLLQPGVTSQQKLGSGTLHLEFRVPYQPQDRGQGRGNSGCYVQGRYEVQILDSFGLDSKDNDCGGIYSVSAPALNMSYPPLAWQTYDIDFVAARYDAQGQLIAAPRITVRHNGVVIHRDVELKKVTPGGVEADGPGPGPLHLQDHGNPVRFRNIWFQPRN